MECLEWDKAIGADGYGRRWDRGKVVLVHRWAVAQVLGWEAIEGQFVIHTCDNRACYRYEHLRVADHTENMRDAWEKRRIKGSYIGATHCQRGHEFTEANTYVTPKGHRNCRTCRYAAVLRNRGKG